MKRKIILDCDPGMDDSMAIVLAAKAAALELLAVTTVCGNYPQEVTCVNARKMLELLGRTIRYPELDVYSATQLLEQTEEHSKA